MSNEDAFQRRIQNPQPSSGSLSKNELRNKYDVEQKIVFLDTSTNRNNISKKTDIA